MLWVSTLPPIVIWPWSHSNIWSNCASVASLFTDSTMYNSSINQTSTLLLHLPTNPLLSTILDGGLGKCLCEQIAQLINGGNLQKLNSLLLDLLLEPNGLSMVVLAARHVLGWNSLGQHCTGIVLMNGDMYHSLVHFEPNSRPQGLNHIH